MRTPLELPQYASALHYALGNSKTRKVLDKWLQEHPGEPLPLSEQDVEAIALEAVHPDFFKRLRKNPGSDKVSYFALLKEKARNHAPQLANAFEGKLREAVSNDSLQNQLALYWARTGHRIASRWEDETRAKELVHAAATDIAFEGDGAKAMIARLRKDIAAAQTAILEFWPKE